MRLTDWIYKQLTGNLDWSDKYGKHLNWNEFKKVTEEIKKNSEIIVYSQNDKNWANHKLGYGVTTISQDGCALSSVAIMLTYLGYVIDPNNLNEKLKRALGFYGSLIIWSAVNKLQDLVIFQERVYCDHVAAPLEKIDKSLEDGIPVIAKVDYTPGGSVQQHWVCIFQKKGKDYIIGDPRDGKIESFTNRYGDPARYIYGLAIYKKNKK